MLLVLDVVVEVHRRLTPLGELVRLARQVPEHWTVVALEELSACDAPKLLHRPRVHVLAQLGDAPIQCAQREEGFVPEARQDPSLRDLDGHLDLRLVTGLVRPSRHDRRPVMPRHLGVAPLDPGLVPARLRHARFQLVGHSHLRHPAEVFVRADVRSDEIRHPLRFRRLRVRVVARAEHRHEELHLDDLTGAPIDVRGLLARVVDEALLARLVRLPHHDTGAPKPPPVHVAVRRVSKPARVRLQVLKMQKLERDAHALQLLVHVHRIRTRAIVTWHRWAPVQPFLERSLVERLRRRPREPGCHRTCSGLLDAAHAHTEATRHLAHGPPLRPQS